MEEKGLNSREANDCSRPMANKWSTKKRKLWNRGDTGERIVMG
jgi:hypothetical protein